MYPFVHLGHGIAMARRHMEVVVCFQDAVPQEARAAIEALAIVGRVTDGPALVAAARRYRAVEGIILQADKVNPALGSRLLTAFEQWRILEPRAKAEAEATLKRLQAAGLSSNSADIVARALG